MNTERKDASAKRIETARKKRIQNTKRFAIKLAARNGLQVVEHSCQYGYRQRVSEVHVLGNMYFYKSIACSGCKEGEQHIANARARGFAEPPPKVLGCMLVEDNALVSLTKVSPGQIITPVPLGTLLASKFKIKPKVPYHTFQEAG